MADRAELAENANDLVFIDVLVANQFSPSSSAQLINTADLIYCNCKVWVFLDDDYLGRAWCLAECGQYTRPESKCVLVVYGKAEFKPGSDFLQEMKAGVAADLPLIKSYILDKFKSKEAFNQAIDSAIVMLSPLSLLCQGRYSEAKIACEQEIRMLRASQSDDLTALTKATVTMAEVMGRLGDLEAATDHLTCALETCGEFELELRGKIMNGFGYVLSDQGKYSEALTYYEKSLDLRVQCFCAGHVTVAHTHNNIGEVHREKGDFEKAMFHYETALAIYIPALGTSHVNVAAIEKNIGIVLFQQGDLKNAMLRFKKALEIEEECLGTVHASVAGTYTNMGNVYESLGDLENALIHHHKAVDIYLRALGPDHVDVARTEMNIGNVLFRQGDYENALVHHWKALAIQEVALGPSHVSVAATRFNMGLVYQQIGNISQARSQFKEAHKIQIQALGSEHPDTKITVQALQKLPLPPAPPDGGPPVA